MNNHNNIAGIYPGTFDPVTFGHLDIVERATNIVDKLIQKKSINQIFSNNCLIEVVGFDNLLVDHAKKLNAKVIIRGLRAVADFEYEFQMAGMNAKLEPNIETIFLMASENLQLTSARFVKEVAFYNGKINNFVPKNVINMFKKKMEALKWSIY